MEEKMAVADKLAVMANSPADYERLGLSPTSIAPWEDGARTDDSAGTYEWWYLESHYAMRLIESASGGVGYLLKERVSDVQTFADAVRRVAEGEFVIDPGIVSQLVGRRRAPNPLDDLTRRELEVLGLMAEGRSNRSICDKLFLSDNTVETHVKNILSKLNLEEGPDANRRVLAVLTYLRRGASRP